MMDLAKFLKIRAEKYGEKPFLFGEGTSISYRTFDQITNRLADGLEKLGVAAGDHIAVLHPNSPQTLLSYYSIIKAGGIVVPINTIYTPREIKFILNNSEAKVLILHEHFLSVLEEIKSEIHLVKNFIVRRVHETVETAV